jgi:hypothetical protein
MYTLIYTYEQYIPLIPNPPSTIIHLASKNTKTNIRNPLPSLIKTYIVSDLLFLLKCGDIENNHGPMRNLLQTHPTPHRRRKTTYLIPTCRNPC